MLVKNIYNKNSSFVQARTSLVASANKQLNNINSARMNTKNHMLNVLSKNNSIKSGGLIQRSVGNSMRSVQCKSMQIKSMQSKSMQSKSMQSKSMQSKSMQSKSMQGKSMQTSFSRQKTSLMSNTMLLSNKNKQITPEKPISTNQNIENNIHNKINTYINKYNIKKITNIYQEKFFNSNASGLGDFIRGSLFLMQFCEKYKIVYEISLKNHKIFKLLQNGLPDSIDKNDMNISKLIETNHIPYIKQNYEVSYKMGPIDELLDKFINYIEYSIKLQRHTNKNNNINVNVICFPLYDAISIEHKNYMKNVFEPNDNMKQYVIDQLTSMDLTPKKYNIIHIRCGDEELIDKKINIKTYQKVYNYFNDISNSSNYKNENFLVLSDSVNLKNILKQKYPRIKVFSNIICHIGEGEKNNDNTIKSLLTDFYFISYSSNIFSLSVHGHGTGFSKWTSVIYDIPYKCVFIG